MTVQETKGYLEHMLEMMDVEPPENLTDIRDIKEWEDEHSKIRDTLEISLSALEEVEQYRALGTVEELKEAREKQVAKKPIHKIKRPNSLYGVCSVCGRRLVTDKYCPRCGQRILWKEGGTSE